MYHTDISYSIDVSCLVMGQYWFKLKYFGGLGHRTGSIVVSNPGVNFAWYFKINLDLKEDVHNTKIKHERCE